MTFSSESSSTGDEVSGGGVLGGVVFGGVVLGGSVVGREVLGEGVFEGPAALPGAWLRPAWATTNPPPIAVAAVTARAISAWWSFMSFPVALGGPVPAVHY